MQIIDFFYIQIFGIWLNVWYTVGFLIHTPSIFKGHYPWGWKWIRPMIAGKSFFYQIFILARYGTKHLIIWPLITPPTIIVMVGAFIFSSNYRKSWDLSRKKGGK